VADTFDAILGKCNDQPPKTEKNVASSASEQVDLSAQKPHTRPSRSRPPPGAFDIKATFARITDKALSPPTPVSTKKRGKAYPFLPDFQRLVFDLFS
jgi:hypothetical protein